jgi:hypothetical protein
MSELTSPAILLTGVDALSCARSASNFVRNFDPVDFALFRAAWATVISSLRSMPPKRF